MNVGEESLMRDPVRAKGHRVVAAVLVAAMLNGPLAFAQTAAAKPAGKAAPSAGAATPASASPAAAPAPAAPPAAPALEPLAGDAKANYEAGKLLFGDGDFNGALLKFKAAYDATKDPRPLWNMAACEKMLRHYSRAVKLVTLYLQDDRVSADERGDATRLKNTLSEFTGPLAITVTEDGADVSVDGEGVGQSPLPAPVTLDIGSRKIEVKKPGFRVYSGSVVVSSGSNAPLQVKLAPDLHQGHLVVKAPAGASIVVDGAAVGVGAWEGTLASGGHSLRVSATGMHVYQGEVSLTDDQTRTLDVTLEPEQGGMPKWVWFAGSAALVVAGAAVGGYFLFKKPETTTQTTDGTLGPAVMLP
jgi:hypothetical protein